MYCTGAAATAAAAAGACVCVPAVSKQDDCEVGAGGARKACKNCSCGRAEAEAKGEKVQLTQDMLDNPQSSCGNVSVCVRRRRALAGRLRGIAV